MARHGENIYKRRDGRYEGRYVVGKQLNGRTKFGYIYARQYAEVRRQLLLKKAELLRRSNAPGAARQGTLAQWLDYWMENELLGSIKPSSYQTYRRQMARHLLPRLGDCPLAQLTPRLVHQFVEQLESTGLAMGTIRGVYRLLSAAMRFALDEGVIARNPCRKIRIQRGERAQQRVLTRGEQDRLRAAATDARELPALLSLYTGMRLGEICALQWSDIDWEKETILVRRTAQRVSQPDGPGKTLLMVGTPKSLRSQRVLPVPSFVLDKLRALPRGASPASYIFGRAGQAAEPRTIQRRFTRLLCKLGMAGAHFRTLRHTFATRLLELGVDIKTISALLGHSSARTTLDFYAHSLIDQQRSAIERLAAC